MRDKGFDWAYRFDGYIKDSIENKKYEDVPQIRKMKYRSITTAVWQVPCQ